MKTPEAIKIVASLADGVNPYTGESLSNASVFNDARTVRALFVCLDALDRLQKSEERKSNLPLNAAKPWNEEEDKLL